MTDIVYVANHGFSARMIMQTDLLGKLVANGCKVALIAPDKEDANLVHYCGARDIELFEFKPQKNRWTGEYFRARKYLLDDIKANPCLWERHVLATKYNRSKKPWRQIRPRLYLAAYYLRKLIPGISTWYRRKEQAFLDNEEALALLQKINPRIFVSTYPVNFAEGMLQAAARRIGSLTYIHLLSWDNITGKGTFMELADRYLLWGKVMAEELIDYYKVQPAQIELSGVPHFDRHVAARNKPEPEPCLTELGLRPDQPYLFFGMSSAHFTPREIDIVEHLAQQVTKHAYGENMQLVVRPHPQNISGALAESSWLPRLEKLDQIEGVSVFYPEMVESGMAWSMKENDMTKLVQLIAGSTIVFNSGSTITIDAMMCNRPVIITSFDADAEVEYWKSAKRLLDYTHLKKITDNTGVEVARSFAQLEKLIITYLATPDKNYAKRQATIRAYCANFDEGQATDKVVDLLSQAILKNEKSLDFA